MILNLLNQRKIKFQALSSAQDAKQLNSLGLNHDNLTRLCDNLIIAAIIEARSCERFYALLPCIQYVHLAQGEQRHFEIYLDLAKALKVFSQERLTSFIQTENGLIL